MALWDCVACARRVTRRKTCVLIRPCRGFQRPPSCTAIPNLCSPRAKRVESALTVAIIPRVPPLLPRQAPPRARRHLVVFHLTQYRLSTGASARRFRTQHGGPDLVFFSIHPWSRASMNNTIGDDREFRLYFRLSSISQQNRRRPDLPTLSSVHFPRAVSFVLSNRVSI